MAEDALMSAAKLTVTVHLPGSLDFLRVARQAVADLCAQARAPVTWSSQLEMAVDEACANIIRHAYRGCGDGRIALRIERHRERLRFRLRDRAPAVDPGCVRPRDLSECRPGGLGINIIDETMDHWRLRPLKRHCGNVLTMVRRLHARKA